MQAHLNTGNPTVEGMHRPPFVHGLLLHGDSSTNDIKRTICKSEQSLEDLRVWEHVVPGDAKQSAQATVINFV